MEPPRLPDSPTPPAPPALPPVPPVAPPPPGAAGPPYAPNQGRDWLGEAQKVAPKVPGMAMLHLKRAMAPDIAAIVPEPDEVPLLEKYSPGRHRLHSLLAWRRSLLLLCTVLFGCVIIKDVALGTWTFRQFLMDQQASAKKQAMAANPNLTGDQFDKQMEPMITQAIKQIGEDNVSTVEGIFFWLPHVGYLVGAWLLIRAIQVWPNFAESRKMLLKAWLCIVAPRVLTLLIPVTSLLDFEHLKGMDTARAEVMTALRGLSLTAVVAILVPILLGTAFGALRTSLSGRYFVPASAPAGWLTLAIATAIAVPWIVMSALVGQMGASAWIYAAVLFLTSAPLSLWRFRKALIRPMSRAEASVTIRRARVQVATLNGIAVLCLIIFVRENEIVAIDDLISIAVNIVANLFLVSIICMDWLLPMLRGAHGILVADERPDGTTAVDQLDEITAH